MLKDELELLELQVEEREATYLQRGGSLIDPAWTRRMEIHDAREKTLEDDLNAALQEPQKLLNQARHQVNFPRPLLRLHDKSYTDLLLHFHEKEGSRSSSVQSNWRRDLIKVYNSINPDDSTLLWCPIMHGYRRDTSKRPAAHIFSRKYGQKVMNQIFGLESDGDLFRVRNGLIISKEVELKFDAFQLVILPAKPRNEANPVDDWVLRVVDHVIDKDEVDEIGKTWMAESSSSDQIFVQLLATYTSTTSWQC